MGFVAVNVIPLLTEHARRPWHGRVLVLGDPEIYFTRNALEEFLRQTGTSLIPNEASARISKLRPHHPSGEGGDLFRAIGFDDVKVLDISDYQGAELIGDLNDPNMLPEWHGKFDAVIDHGTVEHIFHFPNCLANLFRLLKTGWIERI